MNFFQNVISALIGGTISWLIFTWQKKIQRKRDELKVIEETLAKLKKLEENINDISHTFWESSKGRQSAKAFRIATNGLYIKTIEAVDVLSWFHPYLKGEELPLTLANEMEEKLFNLDEWQELVQTAATSKKEKERTRRREDTFDEVRDNLLEFLDEFHKLLSSRREEIIEN